MARKFKTSDFNYDLPQSSIAQFPAEPRDHCKLMVLDKKSGNLNNVKFFEILNFFKKVIYWCLMTLKCFQRDFTELIKNH